MVLPGKKKIIKAVFESKTNETGKKTSKKKIVRLSETNNSNKNNLGGSQRDYFQQKKIV